MRKTVTKRYVYDFSLFIFLLLQQGVSGVSDYEYEIYSLLNPSGHSCCSVSHTQCIYAFHRDPNIPPTISVHNIK